MEMKVYENMHHEIDRRAFFMWCDQGKPDGEKIIDLGFGKKKLCDYHWMLAELQVEMEMWAAIQKMGPVKTVMGDGYCYMPHTLTKTPVVLDPDVFLPRKGIMTRYGKKMLEEGKKYYGQVRLKKKIKPTPAPKIIDIQLKKDEG